MKNKGFVITLTVVITLLCLYYLSFTWVANNVQDDAIAASTDSKGVISLNKKQLYLDSIWSKPVYNFFGVEYTYSQVKENELSLGLDLQGGMHVTLEVSPGAIIKGLSGNSNDSTITKALEVANQKEKTSQEKYSQLFYQSFKEQNPDKRLAPYFSNTTTRDKISLNDNDDKVLTVIQSEIDNAIQRSYTILKNRIDQFGTTQPDIQILPATGQIQVEIPGIDNPQRVRKLLQGVARLEFWDVIEPNTLSSSFSAINSMLVKEGQTIAALGKTKPAKVDSTLAKTAAKSPTDTTASQLEKQLSQANDSSSNKLDSLKNANVSPLVALSTPPGAFRYSVKDTAAINQIFKRTDIRSLLPRNVGVFWGNKPDKNYGDNALQLYFLDQGRNGKPKLTGEVITDATQDLDEYSRPSVSMKMNATGTKVWARMTADATNKTPHGRIAIVLDNLVYSAPVVNGEIPNGNSQITGSFTLDEAKDLANVLRAGSLPAPTRIVEEAVVGPTLGHVAASQGLISMASGLALVVIFMIAYYSRGGYVADLALVFNIFFILGILAQPTIGAALTLPGIAGIVLTMGMAVDANVLIYERIKEEVAHGRKLKDAIKVGFDKAFWTIFDSNLTTLLTGFFLFILGQGPIKGFAVTLIIGILTSFFTAVYISRVVIEWMTRKGDASHISFETSIARLVKRRRQFGFVGKSKIAYTISSSIIVLGFVLILINGLNLGVDFKGGRSYVVLFNKPMVGTDLKVALTEGFHKSGTQVKNYGSNSIVRITTSYLTDDDSDEADAKVRNALIDGLEGYTHLKFTNNESEVDDQHFAITGSNKVGPTVADDIKKSAWKASLFSLIAIFVYILIRFRKWQYSAGAVIATVHDALFVVAAFGIANSVGLSFEVDQVFVAALLTIIGYSINDTVIIFDRIREYIGMGTSHDRPKIFNDAINDTLSRTFITAGTTLLVVLVLLVFGGEALRGFSFAMFIGIVVGTYSSIFVAAPVVLDLDSDKSKEHKEQKEHKKVPAPAMGS